MNGTLDGSKWYALRVLTNREFKAADKLQRKGFDVYVPMVKRWRRVTRHAKRKRLANYPLLSGYVFLWADLDRTPWRRVYTVPAVVGVVGVGGEPMPLRLGEMEGLQDREAHGEFTAFDHERFMRAGKEYGPGDTVEIVSGAYKGTLTKVVQINATTAKVLVDIFGDTRTATVRLEALEAL